MKEFKRQVLITREAFGKVRKLPYFPLKHQEKAIYLTIGKDSIYIHRDFTGMNSSSGDRFYP